MRPVSLNRLFDPRAVAVVGATETPGKIGRIILEMLAHSGRPVHPVHPTASAVLGRCAFSNVAALPGDVDLAVIALGADKAVLAAEECGRHGIPFIIPVAGGFGEAGEEGRALEDRLTAIRERHGSRLLGPNTLGIYLPHQKIDTIFVDHPHPALAAGGGVAFISQSGSVGTEALAVAANSGFGLRAFVGLGNKCDLDEVDFVDHFAEDDGTDCVALYMETLGEGRAFVEACRRVSVRKPVIVLKAGRTTAGARAASSHTGRLAGADRVVSGAFRQHGIQRADDEEHLFDAARVLSGAPATRGPRVAVVTPGGGYGVLAADLIEATGSWPKLRMAQLAAETVARIREALPAFASVANPVDITASANDAMNLAAVRAVLEDDGVDMVLCIALFAPPGISDALIAELALAASRSAKPLLFVVQHGAQTDCVLRQLFNGGAIGFPSTSRGVRAARSLWERTLLLDRLGETP